MWVRNDSVLDVSKDEHYILDLGVVRVRLYRWYGNETFKFTTVPNLFGVWPQDTGFTNRGCAQQAAISLTVVKLGEFKSIVQIPYSERMVTVE